MTKENLIKEIFNTISEVENEDENLERLAGAMDYFCGTWDKCEGYKHAITSTLEEQSENHIDDLEISELETLLGILTK